MRRTVFALVIASAPAALAATPDEELASCNTRHAAISKQAASFNGDARTKRLIDADLQRALREQAEGDGDECNEALDHAAKLLAGGT